MGWEDGEMVILSMLAGWGGRGGHEAWQAKTMKSGEILSVSRHGADDLFKSFPFHYPFQFVM